MKYLIICDPSGAYCARYIERGISPDDIYVYEDTHKGTVCSQTRGVHVISDLSEVKDMKFDVILGNPPYQGNLAQKSWHKFLAMAVEMSPRVSFIIPASVTSPGKSWDLIRHNLVRINFNVSHHFKGVGSTFCRIIVDRDHSGPTDIITSDSEHMIMDVSGYDFLPPTINKHTLSLYKHLTGTRTWQRTTEYHTAHKTEWFDDKGGIEILHTNAQILRTNVSHSHNSLYRVAVTLSGHPKFHVLHNKGASETVVWTSCESLSAAENLCDYLNSDTIQEVITTFKWSGFNSRHVIKML